MRRSRIWGVAIAALAIVGCGDRDLSIETDDARAYVDVMTRLSTIDARPPAIGTPEERALAADSMRTDVLASHGLEPADLLELSSRLGVDPNRMERLWQLISLNVDSAIDLIDQQAVATRDSMAEQTRFQPDSVKDTPAAKPQDMEALLDTVTDEKRRRLLERAVREKQDDS